MHPSFSQVFLTLSAGTKQRRPWWAKHTLYRFRLCLMTFVTFFFFWRLFRICVRLACFFSDQGRKSGFCCKCFKHSVRWVLHPRAIVVAVFLTSSHRSKAFRIAATSESFSFRFSNRKTSKRSASATTSAAVETAARSNRSPGAGKWIAQASAACSEGNRRIANRTNAITSETKRSRRSSTWSEKFKCAHLMTIPE